MKQIYTSPIPHLLVESEPTISVVVPVFNEEKNIPLLYDAVTDILHNYDYELIFVDDGSSDQSWRVLQTYAAYDERIKILKLSRNFGHQAALMAGYDHACGDAIISMDADLQDPPALIADMIHAWKQGSAIVYARRKNRDDGFLKKLTASWYYWLLNQVSDVNIPRNVGDFRLIDKQVLRVLLQSKEKASYWRGMVAWTGFSHTFIDFERPNRHAGVTGYTWKKMFKLAFDGITGFSLFPLKIAAFVGVFVIISGCAMFAYITIDALFFKIHYPLFKWLVTIIYIFLGVNFLLLWLLGEYIGRIYEQERGRPLYIVVEKKNVKDNVL